MKKTRNDPLVYCFPPQCNLIALRTRLERTPRFSIDWRSIYQKKSMRVFGLPRCKRLVGGRRQKEIDACSSGRVCHICLAKMR